MIQWKNQHCGVHQCTYEKLIELMPDLKIITDTFPDNHENFTWDVKVHMLMPKQYACMPGWHYDYVPRIQGVQNFNLVNLDLPMYLWTSGSPLIQFRNGYVLPENWFKFTQNDEHRGTMSDKFQWRGFIRAIHKDILLPKESNWLRRHCQVYVNTHNYQW